jgi:glycosyltransferase involved in cell wall biosynthesis
MRQDPISILIAIPVLLLGGTEVQTLSVVRTLVATNYRVSVCCYYEFDDTVVKRFKTEGVEVILLGLSRSREKFGMTAILTLIQSLVALFRKQRPDIVHVQYLAPGLIPIIAARLAGVKTVFATVHIAGEAAYGGKAKFLLHCAARLCTAFICVSKGVEEFWFGDSMVLESNTNLGRRKHFTIYNSVETEKIRRIADATDRKALRQELGIPPDAPVIGIVGRLAEQKGHTLLLDAFATVVAQSPEVVLLVVGEGPLRPTLAEQADHLGIGRSVYWMGRQSQEEVFRLYATMDIFVMPSLYEGFGLTAAEAMAAGLPVIGTRVDGLSEIIADGETGILIPPGDINTLARSMLTLLWQPANRKVMGENGRRRVEQLFSSEEFGRSMITAYTAFASR